MQFSQNTGRMQSDTKTCGASEPTTSSESMCSAEDFPARICRTLGEALASKALEAVFGESTRALFASYDRESSSWRTSQLCVVADWDVYSETWPSAGTMLSGQASRLLTLVLPTSASGSSWWGTLLSSDARGPTQYARGNPSLLTQVHWSAPMATDGRRGDCPAERKRNSPSLAAQTTWLTPSASDAKGTTGGGQTRSLRDDLRQWPTLTVHGNTNAPKEGTARGTGLRTAVSGNGPGPLNPAWCEMLMGFPQGWTELSGPQAEALSKSRKSRRGRATGSSGASTGSAVSATQSSRKSHT